MSRLPFSPSVKCSLSVVSHGHGPLLIRLLDSLTDSCSECGDLEVIVTFNLPEPTLLSVLTNRHWSFRVKVIHNALSKGFGANHNQAFQQAAGSWFGVVNPDIVWTARLPAGSGLSNLLDSFEPAVALVVPAQVNMDGAAQDSMRRLITPWGVLTRAFQREVRLKQVSGVAQSAESADWVNGACMFFRVDTFRALGGFDERYFMYCEDADICLRLQLMGMKMQGLNFSVVHDAQRNTHRNLKHLSWHVVSLLRFWTSSVYWRYWWAKTRNLLN